MQIQQFFGNDLSLTAQGTLAQSDSDEYAKESIIRRLLTNPGTYFWQPEYGAGVGRFIGENLSTANFDEIKNLIISQMLLEETVSKSQPPQVSLKALIGDFLQCDIIYYSAITNHQISISFQVS